jgi:uncharacterized protein (TIGR00297 family)
MISWLSPGGAAAALAVGGLVTAGLGWAGLALLLVFFLSSTLLTPGGGRRGAGQVAANGGLAAVAAVLARSHPAFRLAFAGALAAAAADTWSTEIGSRGARTPRLLVGGHRVARGTSGGVTWLGTVAGMAGAVLMAVAAALLGIVAPGAAVSVAAGGILGGVADSFLGATLQARYSCARCGTAGERPALRCGHPAILDRGLAWMTNDTVNVAATLVGAVVAALPVILGGARLA